MPWNQATLARSLLDGERFPKAHFVSSRVEPIDARRARDRHPDPARVSQEITLDVTQRHQALPLPPFRRTAGSASTTLSRRAFGITAWPGVIGDAVQLRIEAEATLDRSDAPGTPAPVPHSDPKMAR